MGISEKIGKSGKGRNIGTEEETRTGSHTRRNGGESDIKLRELVGIVSNTDQATGKCRGTNPRPYLALPVWIINQIMDNGIEE